MNVVMRCQTTYGGWLRRLCANGSESSFTASETWHYKASGVETHQTLRDMAMLKEAANSGPAVLEAAQAALRAKRTNKHVAERLVALLMVAENLKPENASIRAAEILGRDNSASILRQYRRFAANNKPERRR